MEMEQIVEMVRIPRTKAGDTTIKGNGNFDANGKLKTVKKRPSAKEILDRMENETKTAKKITKQVVKGTSKPEAVTMQMLIDAFKGTLVTDTDKNGFTNFRYPGSKKIIFYCIQRNFGITVSTRNDSAKSGWKSQRLATKQDLKTFVASIKAQVGD